MRIHTSQRDNPLLKSLAIPYELGPEIQADFELDSIQIYFLSLKYHLLFPEYILKRLPTTTTVLAPESRESTSLSQSTPNIQDMRSMLQESRESVQAPKSNPSTQRRLRVLLLLIDMDQFHQALQELTRFCLQAHITLMLAWSDYDACRILETLKAFEYKSPDLIKEKVDALYFPKLTDALTQIKSVNKTDVMTLLSTFGSFSKIVHASSTELAECPGLGSQKIKRLLEAFDQPFMITQNPS